MSLKDLRNKIIEDFPITAIVGQYIALSRKGTNTLGLCPFHQDSKPSMHVTDDKKMYKCFSCGAGGNAIDFVVNYKSLDFIEALKEISGHVGLNFDDYTTKQKKSPKQEMAEKILERSSMLYLKFANPNPDSPFGDFIKKRGLSVEVAKEYALGYAPKSNSFLDYLGSIPNEKDRKFAIEVAEEVGLLKPDMKSGNGHYDTFRERIIFPIWNQYGRVIAYTSRATKEYQKAKYLNSKESFLFNKRNILYGLHLAKPHIRSKDAVILVEGNMDQISLYAKGFKNSVAIMGIALGDNSLKILKGLTKNIYLCLDNDNAGYGAAERINQQWLSNGITPKFVDLNPHKDPDDFLMAEGSIALQKRIDEAKPFIDIQIKKLIPNAVPELLDKKLTLLKDAFEVVAPLGKGLDATERLFSFAKSIGLKSDPSMLTDNYLSFLGEMPKQQEYNEAPPLQEPYDLDESYHEALENYSNEEQFIPVNEELITTAEARLIKEIIINPECLTHSKISELLDFVANNEVKEYVLGLKNLLFEIDESEYASVVSRVTHKKGYSRNLCQIVDDALLKHRPISLEESVVEKIIGDIKFKLQESSLKDKKIQLKNKRSLCETEAELNKLMNEILAVEKELLNLKKNKNKKINS